jgi:hypothetical protein
MKEIRVPETISVGELAALLGQAPLKVVGDLMDLGVFASLEQSLPFDMICKAALKYGYTAKKPA